jgi:superfamily II DNA or RNA helicase
VNAGLISESDIQLAAMRLRRALPAEFCRQYFGRDRLLRLERIVGEKIGTAFLADLIVRQQGPQLLAERPRRIGNATTSIRRALLEALDDDALGALHERLRGRPMANRKSAELELARFKWTRGSASALRIVRAVGLPDAFAGVRTKRDREAEYDVEPIGALPPLKAFQRGILRELRRLLDGERRAMVSSFTGTGKTRMGMEYVVDALLGDDDAPLVVWVAQKGELLEQACEAIEQVWPWRGQECGEPLHVCRYWDGNQFEEELARRPTLVVASSQQILARLGSGDAFVRTALSRARLLVIDEAHHALARGHRELIEEYETLRKPRAARTLGLTATPGRSNLLDPEESRKLAELFARTLVVPKVAGRGGALAWFQREGYLSQIRHRQVEIPSQVAQTLGKRRIADTDQSGYRDFTQEFLEVVGEDSTRNRAILERLTSLDRERRQMLVFCCNVAQAELLAQALVVQGTPAGVIHHGVDPRDRHHTVAQFRRGELRLLFNVEVLTTGFDAPRVDTIVMCRPTLSRVLYEQMVGRGMRGPKMGGTEWCEIVDFTSNFGTFREPQAWEYFWEEWGRPESENLEKAFETLGWSVVAAEPESGEAGG